MPLVPVPKPTFAQKLKRFLMVDLLKGKPIALTRLARGISAGGGLETADELTLSAALSGRTKL